MTFCEMYSNQRLDVAVFRRPSALHLTAHKKEYKDNRIEQMDKIEFGSLG